MHPVLKVELHRLADTVRGLSLEEAQVHPLPGIGRWSAQEIVEHLILSYKFTSEEVKKRLDKGQSPRRRRGILEIFLRLQTLGLGNMTTGVPSMLRLKPKAYTPCAGPELAERFLAAGEEMDAVLAEARRKFGIQACGEHPMYGVLRVDEWRRYHAVHARHHMGQLKNTIQYARSQAGSVPAQRA